MTDDASLPVRPRARMIELARRRRVKIIGNLLQGVSKRDVARQEGISVRRLNVILHRAGVSMPFRNGCRPLPVVFIHTSQAKALEGFAAEMEVTPPEVAGWLLKATLEGDADLARRLLRKRRLS